MPITSPLDLADALSAALRQVEASLHAGEPLVTALQAVVVEEPVAAAFEELEACARAGDHPRHVTSRHPDLFDPVLIELVDDLADPHLHAAAGYARDRVLVLGSTLPERHRLGFLMAVGRMVPVGVPLIQALSHAAEAVGEASVRAEASRVERGLFTLGDSWQTVISANESFYPALFVTAAAFVEVPGVFGQTLVDLARTALGHPAPKPDDALRARVDSLLASLSIPMGPDRAELVNAMSAETLRDLEMQLEHQAKRAARDIERPG